MSGAADSAGAPPAAASPAPAAAPAVIGRGSMAGWAVFLMMEATLTQGLLAFTLVPLMVLVSLPRVLFIALVGRREEARRLSITTGVTVVAGGLAIALTAWQNGVARARAGELVAACEKYQTVEGRLPPSLEALVPRYLPLIPPLKPLAGTEAWYSGEEVFPYLSYVELPPFGKRVYSFQRKSWDSRD